MWKSREGGSRRPVTYDRYSSNTEGEPYSECPASNERWGDKGGLSLIWQRSTPPFLLPSPPQLFLRLRSPFLPARTTPSPPSTEGSGGREKEEKGALVVRETSIHVCVRWPWSMQTCVDVQRDEREERGAA